MIALERSSREWNNKLIRHFKVVPVVRENHHDYEQGQRRHDNAGHTCFDHSAPAPLGPYLTGHAVTEGRDRGCGRLSTVTCRTVETEGS